MFCLLLFLLPTHKKSGSNVLYAYTVQICKLCFQDKCDIEDKFDLLCVLYCEYDFIVTRLLLCKYMQTITHVT